MNQDVIGKTVYKTSGKPFKCGSKLATVSGVVDHPITGNPAYIIKEDGTTVEARMCKVFAPITLDEAIAHAVEQSGVKTQCQLEHMQLAEWLKELKQFRVSSGA